MDEAKNHWEMRKEYVQNPKNSSQRLYWQNAKYWSKNDEMYLGDIKNEENPNDDFKKDRLITKKKKENLEKAMTRNFTQKRVRIKNQQKRWTEVEGPFKSTVPFCDTYPAANIHLSDIAPMYSSFSPDRVFQEKLSKIIQK